MKTAEAKSSPLVVQRKVAGSFFSKEGDSFFTTEHKNAPKPFFTEVTNGRASIPVSGVQAKLNIGKPNDQYEKEADTMADKVVQRLAQPKTISTNEQGLQAKPVEGLSSASVVQSKCAACEKEEKIHKKEKDDEKDIKKIQRKPIFESDSELTVQKKADSLQSKTENNGKSSTKLAPSVQKVAASDKATVSVQPKCNACEQEEKLQMKEEENTDENKKKIFRKPVFESNAEPPDDEKNIQRKCATCEGDDELISKKAIQASKEQYNINLVQRSCRECEEGDKVLMKPMAGIQRSEYDQSPDADGSRTSIVAAAKGELGKVEARLNDGTGSRVGAERLLEYFHIAAPGVWDDSIIRTAGAKMPSWCGIFSVWAHKKAGKNIGEWQMGKGVSAFGTLTQTDNPQPGDIGYIHKPNQHHAVVKEVQGDKIQTIDGNSGVNSEVKENTKARSEYSGFLTAFGGGSEPVSNVQTKGEADTASNEASSSVESRLNSTAGKGTSLPADERSNLEQSFGADFSQVRIHTDSTAQQLSKDLNAQAFTRGSDIYFNAGKYDTNSSTGKHLLAHELTHTIQQGSAPYVDKISKSAEENEAAEAEGEIPNPSQEREIEQQVQEDLSRDDFGGSTEREEEGGSAGQGGEQPGGTSTPSGSAEVSEEEMDSEAEVAEEEEETPEGEEAEGEESDAVPDNTPVDGGGTGDCPRIVPEFPSPPENATIEEDEESFYEELIQIAISSGISSVGGTLITRVLGIGAYTMWRRLPISVKVRIINIVLDRAISGAYLGRMLGRYGTNSGLLSAAMLGFFKRLRRMPDRQKVALFEKFGRIILRGDLSFTLGMLKGILMGFFLDGLLGIVQMVIDIICIIPQVINFFRTIENFLSQLPYEVAMIMNGIEEFMASIGDVISNATSELMAMLRDPTRMLNILDEIYQAAANAAERIGEAMADGLIRYAALPAAALGEMVGRIGGQLAFEAVLVYFTAGGGAAVTAAKTALRAIGRGMATIGRQIFRVVRLFGRVLRFVRNAINSIMRFLTPLLRTVARLARTVVDRIAALFRAFRRHCRPGSIRCNLPRPRCRGRYRPRLGGFLPHDRYVTRVTGQNRDYRLRGSLFGIPAVCNYDAKMGRLLVEGKTGYSYLPFIQRSRPHLYRAIMLHLNEQRWRCMAIAARCGFPYIWYMQQRAPAEFLAYRWHGMPPVLHRP